MEGYIKLYRKLMDSPVWSDPHYLKIWMYCLMKASHKKREVLIGNQVVELEPGQFITGRNSLANELNKGMKPSQKQSEISWWRYLNNLQKWEMLNINKTNKYSVVSIVKWCEYQESEQQVNNKRTTDEQQMNTNKNGKNGKNDKKKDSPKQVYDENSLYYKMADYFYRLILKNNPEHKEPNLQAWADDCRKIVELDKRNKDQVRRVMEWVHNDDFEQRVVLSPSKLRKRYDDIYTKVLTENKKNKPRPQDEYKDDSIKPSQDIFRM